MVALVVMESILPDESQQRDLLHRRRRYFEAELHRILQRNGHGIGYVRGQPIDSSRE